jgi:hypothetical protein
VSVTMIRAKVREERGADVEAAAVAMFSAIEEAQPEGVRYASCRVGDGATFIILLQLDEGTENPLGAVPEFREFQANLRDWFAGPPTTEQATVVGSYNLF